MLTPEAQQALHVQCKARVALLRRQGGAVKSFFAMIKPSCSGVFCVPLYLPYRFFLRFPWRCVKVLQF